MYMTFYYNSLLNQLSKLLILIKTYIPEVCVENNLMTSGKNEEDDNLR